MKILRALAAGSTALPLRAVGDFDAAARARAPQRNAGSSSTGPTAFRGAAALLSGVIVLAVNFPVLDFDWLIFDDDINILVNPHLGMRATESVQWAFENVDYMRRYLPLGWLMFAGLLAVDGYSAPVFHAAGWVLTALNTVLIYFVFEKLCRKFAGGSADAQRRGARRWTCAPATAFTALLWSLHPLRVENAAWISGLLYVASTNLALGAVLLYLRSLEGASHDTVLTRTAAAVLYLGSLLVYPVFLSLPAVLVCGSLAFSRGSVILEIGAALRRTAAWWLAAAFCGGMNTFARATASAAYVSPDTNDAFNVAEVFAQTSRALGHYVAQTLWPGDVAAFYGAADNWLEGGRSGIATAFVFVVAATLLAFRSSRRPVTCWLVASAAAVAPFLAQMDATFHPSDRYTVLWLAVWLTPLGLVAASARGKLASSATLAVLALAFIGLGGSYREALPNWKNTASLQASIDRKTAAAPSVQFNFARAATASWWLGDQAGAQSKLQAGAARFPNHPAMGAARDTLNDFDRRWRQRVGNQVEIPPLAVLHVDLGRSWLGRGEPAAAAAHFMQALRLAPEYREAAHGLLQAHAGR